MISNLKTILCRRLRDAAHTYDPFKENFCVILPQVLCSTNRVAAVHCCIRRLPIMQSLPTHLMIRTLLGLALASSCHASLIASSTLQQCFNDGNSPCAPRAQDRRCPAYLALTLRNENHNAMRVLHAAWTARVDSWSR